jgi:uncharacterized protein
MTTHNLGSSAPHVYPATNWDECDERGANVLHRDGQGRVDGVALHRSSALEIGIRRWSCGKAVQAFANDELRYFMKGLGVFRSDGGEVIEVEPGTAVHFKQGWKGEVEVAETLDASYVSCSGGSAERTPVLRGVMTAGPLKEWGPVSKPLEGVSQTAGILLSREPDKRAESGIWTCTPGTWRCVLKSDEFCHFLAGSSTYTHDSGEVIEIKPDTLAYFPVGWSGKCQVHETARKVYMIR